MTGIFFGCTTRSDPRLYGNLKELLSKAGLEYKALGIDLCCGAPLLLSGNEEASKKQAAAVAKEIAESGVTEIATPCPHCFTILAHEYKEKFGVEIGVKMMHITQLLLGLYKDGKLSFTKPINKRIVYHDPCYIGRQGDGIYDAPRELLSAVPGLELVESPLTRDNATCCGGGGLVRGYLPNLAVQVAAEKIEQQYLPIDVVAATSSCPFCFTNLNDGAEFLGQFEVYDIIDLLLQASE